MVLRIYTSSFYSFLIMKNLPVGYSSLFQGNKISLGRHLLSSTYLFFYTLLGPTRVAACRNKRVSLDVLFAGVDGYRCM